MDFSEPRTLLLLGAVAIGLIYGFTARLSGFCLRSAIIEAAERRAGLQTVTWLVAFALALLGTQAAAASGLIDLTGNLYVVTNLTWLSLVIGGLAFGFGMVLTRGCGGRHLVLAAGGNLRSWIVLLVLGLTAYMTLRGLLALPRTAIEEFAVIANEGGDISLGALAAAAGYGDAGTVSLLVAVAVAAVCLITALRLRGPYSMLRAWVPGIVIGLLIPAGWYVTGVLGFDDFEPTSPVSISFTSPVANSIQYLMTFTGDEADFGIAVVGLTIVGAFIAALFSGSFKLEGFDTPGHMLRYIGGAALMGFGGILALGCTVGAGLTGVSTLSLASIIALVSIVAGGTIGHRIKTFLVGGRAPEVVPAE